jgi:hypothetical protein
MLLMKFRVE